MNIEYLESAPLSLPTIKDITTEHIRAFAMQRIPHHIIRGIDVEWHQDPIVDEFVAVLVAHFNAGLVKENIEDGGTEEAEEVLPSDLHWLPARPVDHLIEFLRAYLPTRIGDWLFLRFYQEKTLPVKKTILRQITKKYIHKHYHVIPRHLDQMGECQYWRYLAWQGDYYNGSSEEWGDLVKLRDMVLDASERNYDSKEADIYLRYGNLVYWISKIANMAHEMKYKADSDRAKGK